MPQGSGPAGRVRLLCSCFLPGYPADSRVARTFRLVGGLATAEIARAFLVPEPTIAQRLVRAKRTIRDRGLPYEVPEGAELAGRLPPVLAGGFPVFYQGGAPPTPGAPPGPRPCRGGPPPRPPAPPRLRHR